MKDNLEILRNTLLISSVLLLVYILYKRLLHMMSRENVKSKYPNIGNSIEFEGNEGLIKVELKMKMNLKCSIFNADNQPVLHVAEGEYQAGEHVLRFAKNQLAAGRYYYKVTSEFQEASQYFTVV